MLNEFQAKIPASCMDSIAVDGTYTIRYESLGDGMHYLDSVEIDGREVELNMVQSFAVLNAISEYEREMKARAADNLLP